MIIDGGSFANVISSDLVNALSLSMRRLPTPRYMQWMNQSDTMKITHKARVKFSVGTYIDTVDCDAAPFSAYHLLLGLPWQFDLDATHGGRFNNYSFVHKGVHHVLKPMSESTIKAEVFASVRKKKNVAATTPKPRTALLQEGENGVTVSASVPAASNGGNTSNARENDGFIKSLVVTKNNSEDSETAAISKIKTDLIHRGKDDMNISSPITSGKFCTDPNISAAISLRAYANDSFFVIKKKDVNTMVDDRSKHKISTT